MAETQSRYSIIEEMTNRILNQKEKLANIQRDYDNGKWMEEQKVIKLRNEIRVRNENYEIDHRRRLRELTVTKEMLESEFARKVEKLKNEIDDENNNYKKDHEDAIKEIEEDIADINENLERYKKDMEAKISEKNDIIKEIEKGIKDLKEISASESSSPMPTKKEKK